MSRRRHRTKEAEKVRIKIKRQKQIAKKNRKLARVKLAAATK
jgi:hypothetical protein